MSEHVENIEARLCEYIDGMLDAAERAEIEKHLAANPAHMRLVLDLISQRQMLRQLPRETAPADLADPLHAQFEREALLGPDAEMESQMVLRPSRWPQLLSAAAVLFLAAGLGAIVYFVLPPKHPAVTLLPPPRGASTLPDNLAPLAAAAPKEAQDALKKASENLTFAAQDQTRATEGKQENPPADAAKLGLRGFAENRQAIEDHAIAAREVADPSTVLRGAAFFAGANDNQVLLITIKAPDVKLANDEVVKYLASNNISWSPLDGKLSEVASAPMPVPAAAPAPASPSIGGASGFGGGGGFAMAAPASAARPADQAIEPTGLRRPAAPAIAPPMLAMGDASRADVAGPAIFVRNMNGQQVTELAASLSQPQRQQWAQIEREVALKISKVNQPASRARAITQLSDDRPIIAGALLPATTRPSDGLLVTPESSLSFDKPAVAPTTVPTTQPTSTAIAFGSADEAASDRILVAGGPASDAYNCVIVFENTGTAAPMTQPATAPAPSTQP